jgi:hypothetical protein
MILTTYYVSLHSKCVHFPEMFNIDYFVVSYLYVY